MKITVAIYLAILGTGSIEKVGAVNEKVYLIGRRNLSGFIRLAG